MRPIDDLRKILKEYETQVLANVKKAILTSAVKMHGEIVKGMKAPHSGRTYKRGGKMHTASAPGQMPAVDRGRLVGSIKWQSLQGGLAAFVGIADGATVKYGKYLEYGTAHISPRPWLRPSYELVLPELRRAINAALEGKK